METFVVIFQPGGIIWRQWGTGTSPLKSPPRLFIRARLLSFWQRQGVSKTPSHYSGSDSIRNTSAGSRAWDRWEMELSTSRFQCVGSHLMSRHRRLPPRRSILPFPTRVPMHATRGNFTHHCCASQFCHWKPAQNNGTPTVTGPIP